MNHVESNKAGCPWIVSERGSGLDKRVERCARIPADDSAYCPKHRLMDQERDADNARRMEKARNGKVRNAALAEALKTSPLRAYNPAFGNESRTGYES